MINMNLTRREFVKIAGSAVATVFFGGCVKENPQIQTAPAPTATVVQTPEIKKTPIDESYVHINSLINHPELYAGRTVSTNAFVDTGDLYCIEDKGFRNSLLHLYANKKSIRPSLNAQNWRKGDAPYNSIIKDIDVGKDEELLEHKLYGQIMETMQDFYYLDISDFSKRNELEGEYVRSDDVVESPLSYNQNWITIVTEGHLSSNTIRDYRPTLHFPFYSENELEEAGRRFKMFKPSVLKADHLKCSLNPDYILSTSLQKGIPEGENLWFQGKIKRETKKYYYFDISSGQRI